MYRELRVFFAGFPLAEREELIQETSTAMIAEFERAPADPKLFRRWMLKFAAVRAQAVPGRKKRIRERAAKLEDHDVLPRTSTATQLFEMRLRSKQRKLLAWAIEQLPANLRGAIEHHLAGRDHKSLAIARGVSVRTADWLIWKATEVLRTIVHSARLTRPSLRS
jgi:DNA-directed RNA polymerase specialized sigma24 family protein